MTPSAVFGMTLYNSARHLPQAIDSLLAQTDGDFGLVMLDDASSDDSERVAMEYVARDSRLRYFRHASRQGMVPTWQEVVALAEREFPGLRYFAWASDHDWWSPAWLARMRAALTAYPDAVLAYPLTQRVDDRLQPVNKPPKAFDTSFITDPAARVTAFAREPVGAGDMVYGLVRLNALRRAAVFRPVMQPDRLLMIELALAGPFVQVPEVLWRRRQPGEASVAKQRTTLFADPPANLERPVWRQHGEVLWREYVAGEPPAGLSRARMAALVLRYQLAYLFRHHNKSGQILHRADNALEAVAQQQKEIGRELRWAVYRMRRTLAPAHVALVARKHALHVWHRGVYRAAVTRRRVRAAQYETRAAARRQFGRVRRAGRKALYGLLVLTHRLGLRGR